MLYGILLVYALQRGFHPEKLSPDQREERIDPPTDRHRNRFGFPDDNECRLRQENLPIHHDLG